MQNVFYWRDVYNASDKFTPYHDVITQLVGGRCKGLEKLRGNHNPPIYSARINISDRLLFTSYKGSICLLDVVLEHEYHKSRFLKHPSILKTFLEGLDAEQGVNAEFGFETVERVLELEAVAEPKPAFVSLQPHQRKLIHFSDEQDSALQVRLPALITGSPGSGKTCVAKAMMVSHLRRHPEQHVMYLTKSAKLVEKLQAELAEELLGCEELLANIEVRTYDAKLPIGRVVTDEQQHFLDWIVSKSKKFRESLPIKAEALFRELRQLSGLTLEAYQELGVKQSLVEKTLVARKAVFEVYQSYQSYLTQAQLISPSFYAFAAPQEMDLIVVDEAQDFSTQQLHNICSFAKNSQLAFFTGDHQVLYDGISKHSFIKDILFKGQIEVLNLSMCYRLPAPVAKFTNQVVALKRCLVGGKADKAESDSIVVAEEDVLGGDISWLNMGIAKEKQSIKELCYSPHTAVITFEEQTEFFGKELDTPKVFTPASYKGLEDETIALAGIFGSPVLDEIAKLSRGFSLEDLAAAPTNRPSAAVHEPAELLLNLIITAMTRCKKNLVIVEDMSNAGVRRRVDIFYQMYQATMVGNQAFEMPKPEKASSQDWLQEVKRLYSEGHQQMALTTFMMKCDGNERRFNELFKLAPSRDDDEKSQVVAVQAQKAKKEVKSVAKAASEEPAALQDQLARLINWLVQDFTEKKLRQLMTKHPEREDIYIKPVIALNAKKSINLMDYIQADASRSKIFLDVLKNDTNLMIGCPIQSLTKLQYANTNFFKQLKLLEKAQKAIKSEDRKKMVRYAGLLSQENALESQYLLNVYQTRTTGQTTYLSLGYLLCRLEEFGLLSELELTVDPYEDGMVSLLDFAVENEKTQLFDFVVKKLGVLIIDPRNHVTDYIQKAVLNNDPMMLRLLKQHGFNLDETSGPDSELPLFTALKENKYEAFEQLVELGASLNIYNSRQCHLLQVVVGNSGNNLSYVKKLLAKGVDVNVRDNKGHTALMLTCVNDSVDMFNFLVEKGAQLDCKADSGYDVFFLAVAGNATKIFERLKTLDFPLHLTEKGETIAHLAAQSGSLSMLQAVLEFKPEMLEMVDTKGDSLLHHSFASGDLSKIQYLMDLGLSFTQKNFEGSTPLFSAAHYGHLNALQFAVEQRAHLNVVNNYNESLAHFAFICCKRDILDFLAIHEPELFNIPNKNGDTLCHLAFRYNDDWILKKLCVNLNFPDSKGMTAAHHFAKVGVIDWEVFNRIDFSVLDKKGNSAGHHAVESCNNDFLKLLFAKRALTPFDTNYQGETLVHVAARFNNIGILDALWECGLEFDKPNKQNLTPKQIALQAGHHDMIRALDECMKKTKSQALSYLSMFEQLALKAEQNSDSPTP